MEMLHLRHSKNLRSIIIEKFNHFVKFSIQQNLGFKDSCLFAQCFKN